MSNFLSCTLNELIVYMNSDVNIKDDFTLIYKTLFK